MPKQPAQLTEVPEEIALFQQLADCISQNNSEQFQQLVTDNPGMLRKVIAAENNRYNYRYRPTLLQAAIGSKREELARFIIQQDPDVVSFYTLCEDDDVRKQSPYEYVFEQKKYEWIKLFCENGADINYSFTPQEGFPTVEQTPLRIAIEQKNNELVEFLLSQPKIDWDKRFGVNKENYLHLAAKAGNAFAARLLIAKGLSVHLCTSIQRKYCDFPQESPLHYAAENGHIEVMNLLLESGADINATDDLKARPIHYALNKGHADAANFLLKKEAELDCWDVKFLWTEEAKRSELRRYMHTIHMAAKNGILSIVKKCCEKKPALVKTAGCYFWGDKPREYIMVLPIDFAMFNKHYDIALYLLENISPEKMLESLDSLLQKFKDSLNSPELVNIFKQLIAKYQLSAFEFVKIFVKSGADVAVKQLLDESLVDINVADEDGNSLLHFAARADQYAVAQLLLDRGITAKPNQANMLSSSLFIVPASGERERKIIKNVIEREHAFIKPLSPPIQPKWVRDLTVCYINKHNKPEKNIGILGDPIHAALASKDAFLDENLELKRGDENYLTAVLTLVVSDGKYDRENPRGKKLIHVPVKISDKEIVSFKNIDSVSSFRNSLVLYSFAGLNIEQTFNIHDIAHNKICLTDERTGQDFEEYIFRQKFYHSEQLLLYFLTQKPMVETIAKQLVAQRLISGSKLYVITLDAHSSLYPCPSCEQTLASYDQAEKLSHGMLPLLITCLDELGLTLVLANKDVRVVTRVSARYPYQKSVGRKSLDEHADNGPDSPININVRNNTLLLRDNMQTHPEVYTSDPQSDAALQQFSVAMDAKLTFFRSGSSDTNLKKRKRSDQDEGIEQLSPEKKVHPTPSPAPQ